ncbi:MAG: response regulator [Planctomycetota bacterium]
MSLKVLLVEDDVVARGAMAKLLRHAGAMVVTASDGSEGLSRLLDDRFDVLLTDLHMPGGMDGFELIDATNRLPLAHRPRRVVAISGHFDRAVIGEMLPDSGTVDYFPKPVDLDRLIDTIGGPVN